MADQRDFYGEFGGKPGLIQKAEDGHVDLTVREKALLGRIWGKGGEQGAEPVIPNGGIDAATGEVWEDASQRRMAISRDERLAKTNGRGIEEA